MKKDLLFYENGISKGFVLSILLSIFCMTNSLAQSRQIKGKISSSDNTGIIPGANIIVKGTSTGTVSDADGNFSISVSDKSSVLVFSYLGYISKEMTVGDQSEINVTLSPDVKTLSEVVVVGYGTQQRKDLTGSISSVSASQIEKVPATTIDQALQGRSAGVQVTNNDGAPGGAVSVKIRGIGTFGDNTPLYVVDGYPISGGLNTLNPNDIASMEILKDASATAIYGSRASNGVVIITTKRGPRDGIQVSFDSYYSIQSKPKFYDVLNAQEFATLAVEVGDRDGVPVLPEWRDPSSLRNINWQEEIYDMGSRQSYNLALRGGNDKVQSSVSLGYFDQKGVVLRSDFKRLNASLNLDYSPIKWLKFGTSIKYARTDGQVRFQSGINGLERIPELIPTMTGNPLTNQVKDANGEYGYYTFPSDAVSGSANVVADIEEQDRQNASNRFLSSAYLELSLLKGLKFKTNLGLNIDDNSGFYFTPTNKRVQSPPQAFYSQSSNNTFEWLWENTLAYSRTLGVHSIDVVAGVSAQENTLRSVGGEGNGLLSNELRSLGTLQSVKVYGYQESWSLSSQFGRLTYKIFDKYIVTGTVRRDGSSKFGPGRKYGIFPSVAVAWRLSDESFMSNIKVVSDFKVRGSWGQAGNQNIGLFGYQGTYTPGNDLRDNRGYVFGATKTYYPGVAQASLPNPELTWETTTQSNVGIDASFFDGKVSLTADYYSKESTDFLLKVKVPSQTGLTEATRNVGSIKNSGFELSLGYRTSKGDFEWGVSGNVTTVNNKIESLMDGLSSLANFSTLNFPTWATQDGFHNFSRSEVGGEVGAFYGFVTDGIFQNEDEIKALNEAAKVATGKPGQFYQVSGTQPGDRKFKDLNGDGIITDDDRKIIGSPIPDFFAGLNFDASYKQFDLSLFFYTSVGNDILNYSKKNLESLAAIGGSEGFTNTSKDYYKNYWRGEGTSNTYARATTKDVNGNNRVSDHFVEDGSFLRLRNIQLGYALPSALLNKASITKVRVYVSAQNLFTITKYSGLDPEIGENRDPDNTKYRDTDNRYNVTTAGLDIGNYPTTRSFTFGLSVQF